MPTWMLVASLAVAAGTPAEADAPLHAVRFVDRNEGWAAGADGLLLHTLDGGATWERQPLPTRGTFHAIQFLTPYIGFIAGREEVQATGGSAGVLLATRDGGLTWTRLAPGALPGLHAVYFIDEHNGWVAGAGTDRCPSGAYRTRDAGRTWQPVPGPRGDWRGAVSLGGDGAVLVGLPSLIETLRGSKLAAAGADLPPGRTLRAADRSGNAILAVGQGGLVLRSDDGGKRFLPADVALPAELLAACDFRGVAVRGDHAWVVGHPGSVVLRSTDGGRSWTPQPTGQPLPLNAVHFIDDACGWAVGELGTVIATTDGGATWSVKRRGGQRAAILTVHARARNTPLDLIARLGGGDGYLIATLAADAPADADAKLAAAVRKAGGAASATLWNFDVPGHLEAADRDELQKRWNAAYSGRAAEELARRVAIAIAVWQPDVVVCDFAGGPAESILVDAVQTAMKNPASFEALAPLHLNAAGWKKLYTLWDGPGLGHVVVATGDVLPGQIETPRELATRLVGLFGEMPAVPKQRALRLLANRLEGGAGQASVMDGIPLAAGGTARRAAAMIDGSVKPDREVQTLTALAQSSLPAAGDPGTILPRLQTALNRLPEEQAANSTTALARQYARSGQWDLARETYQLATQRYSGQPAGLESLRWLLQYHASSEARRRHELKQTVRLQTVQFSSITGEKETYIPNSGVRPLAEGTSEHATAVISDPGLARKWYEAAIGLEGKIAAQGQLAADDPALLFPLYAARRQLGDVDAGKSWYRRFMAEQPGAAGDDPWRTCAQQELWALERSGAPPRFAAACRKTLARPRLDGQLDDDCWRDVVPLRLKSGDEAAATSARFAYDSEYLYIAFECALPAGAARPAVERRGHDMDADKFDRVELLIDLDRDYSTCYRLRVDQRGAAADDCWGDAGWNPKWFIARTGDDAGYTIEAAIRLADLTGDPIPPGKAWAVNVVRIMPGRGIIAAGQPADVTPRPEGCGLLIFTDPGR